MRKALRVWRRVGGSGIRYKKERAEYKLLCGKKKKEENERWIKEAQEAKTEGEVWRVVNKERKRGKGVNKKIVAEEWREYFMRILGGAEDKTAEERGGRRAEDGEQRIEREELRKVLRKLKKGKAAGEDGVPNKVWKLGGEKVEEWVWRFCNRVWRGEGWPESWKDSVIVPLVKKGTGNKVEDYRGVTLMPTLYKVYVPLHIPYTRSASIRSPPHSP